MLFCQIGHLLKKKNRFNMVNTAYLLISYSFPSIKNVRTASPPARATRQLNLKLFTA
jgi:hypothetical protein